MKNLTPKLPENLIPVDDFLKFSKPYLDAERAIAGIKTAPARILEADFFSHGSAHQCFFGTCGAKLRF